MNPEGIEITVPVHRNLRTIQVLDESDCAALVNAARQSAPIVRIDDEGRKCDFYEIPDEYDTLVCSGLFKALAQYLEEVPELKIVLRGLLVADEGYYLVRYGKGDYHQLFSENVAGGTGRILTVNIWLNEDFRGGELVILPDKTGHKPMAGHAVIFPATWEYSYFSKAVEGGEKWCITTFIYPTLEGLPLSPADESELGSQN